MKRGDSAPYNPILSRILNEMVGCNASAGRQEGGRWVDMDVVEDGNWVTSRQPSDSPAFNRAMINLFSRGPVAGHR